HPAELAEFLVGGFAFVLGLVLTLFGTPEGAPPAAFWGGVAFAVCGAPQMVAAVAGTLTLRLVANLVGCFAALANLIVNVRAEAPIGITCYVLVFAACVFFCGRTELACHLRRKSAQKAGAR
ncbi:MAG: hypothetical protein AAFP86_12410, partial [Planctomycetota bacterium]